MTKVIQAQELAAMRRKETKICPICHQPFDGLKRAQACPEHQNAYRQRLWRLRAKQKKLKNQAVLS